MVEMASGNVFHFIMIILVVDIGATPAKPSSAVYAESYSASRHSGGTLSRNPNFCAHLYGIPAPADEILHIPASQTDVEIINATWLVKSFFLSVEPNCGLTIYQGKKGILRLDAGNHSLFSADLLKLQVPLVHYSCFCQPVHVRRRRSTDKDFQLRHLMAPNKVPTNDGDWSLVWRRLENNTENKRGFNTFILIRSVDELLNNATFFKSKKGLGRDLRSSCTDVPMINVHKTGDYTFHVNKSSACITLGFSNERPVHFERSFNCTENEGEDRKICKVTPPEVLNNNYYESGKGSVLSATPLLCLFAIVLKDVVIS